MCASSLIQAPASHLPKTHEKERQMKETNRYPPGWNMERVRHLILHYESQTDEEAIAEDEAAYEDSTQILVEIPDELVPSVRAFLAEQSG
jgi:hypothetical protein